MLLASLLLLVSCGQDDDVPGFEQPPEPEKIRFEISHASAISSSSANASQTRMSIDKNGNCSWTDGDKVGVFIVEGSSDLKASGNWVDNLEMTFNNNKWDYTMPSGKEYYPIDKALHFYAYKDGRFFLPAGDSEQFPLRLLCYQGTSS